MKKVQYKFSDKTTTCYFDAEISYLEKLVEKEKVRRLENNSPQVRRIFQETGDG
jgi:hypothetical protein